jgi:hypothetical protein
MTSAQCSRSVEGIQAGTSSSRTPERKRADTVLRRFLEATIRTGGSN